VATGTGASLPLRGARIVDLRRRVVHRTASRAPATDRSVAQESSAVGDDGPMDPKIVKIIALVLVFCLVGMTFLGLLFF
jgi:hypothetical protein